MSKQPKSSFWRKFCKSCKLENQQVRWNQWVEDERIPLPPPAHQKHPRWSTACALRPIPAVSLALELANITAVANAVGTEVIFLRQLIAQGHPGDMAVGISTSGGSRNIVMALEEARKRKLTTAARLAMPAARSCGEAWRTPHRRLCGLYSPHSGSATVHLPHGA